MDNPTGHWRIGTLFKRRLARFWIEQWKVWRTALDWTVWLYLVLPALWIFGGMYVDLWHHPPQWLRQLPLWTGERMPLVLLFIGRLRTFAEEADVLFLLQKRSWGHGLLLRGAAYTAVILLAMTGAIYGLLLPFFVAVYHFPATTLVTMIAYTWVWANIGAIWRNMIEARFSGLRKWLVKIAAMSVLALTYLIPLLLAGTAPSPIALLIPIVVGVACFAIWLRIKLRTRDAFDSDIQQEQQARLASTQLLLRNVMDRKPRIRLNRPVLFRQSNRIFKAFDGETVLGEMIIKTFLRRLPLIRTWLTFTLISALAVFLSSTVMKPFVVAALSLLLSAWVISHWRGMMAEPYFAQFRWTDGMLRQSAGRVRFWLVVPAVGIFSLISGTQIYGVWGMLAVLPGVLIWRAVSNRITSAMLLRTGSKE